MFASAINCIDFAKHVSLYQKRTVWRLFLFLSKLNALFDPKCKNVLGDVVKHINMFL